MKYTVFVININEDRWKKYSQDTNNIYIIQDYWKEDLLTFVINSYNNTILSEDLVKNIIRQILFGVKHCHDNNIIHNDLKLENILLDMELNL